MGQVKDVDWVDKITILFGLSLGGITAVCGQAGLMVYNVAYSNCLYIIY